MSQRPTKGVQFNFRVKLHPENLEREKQASDVAMKIVDIIVTETKDVGLGARAMNFALLALMQHEGFPDLFAHSCDLSNRMIESGALEIKIVDQGRFHG